MRAKKDMRITARNRIESCRQVKTDNLTLIYLLEKTFCQEALREMFSIPMRF